MTMIEAVAVFLYLRESDEAVWNRRQISEAWGMIVQTAEDVLRREGPMNQRTTTQTESK